MAAREPRDSIYQLVEKLLEVRRRTLDLIADLSDDQLLGPQLSIVNPLLWEIGHVAWFQENWVLRHLGGAPPILANGDELYDSAQVAHDTRWDLPLPNRKQTLDYMQQVLDRVVERHDSGRVVPDPVNGYDLSYFLHLVLYHECMHAEAITYTRQTLEYPVPRFTRGDLPGSHHATSAHEFSVQGVEGDVRIPGGRFLLGSARDLAFVFDNEQWVHEVELAPFAISKTAVTNREFAAFVEDGGYGRPEVWSDAGWKWRQRAQADHPVYWRRAGEDWYRRHFDQLVPLENGHPVIHINWYEADAYCRWAGRRLPTEAEWESAASSGLNSGGSRTDGGRLYPWGDAPPAPARGNLDWRAGGCIDAAALPDGDSASGCRQMIGNVWEWTSTDFGPYPGFAAGPYKEYSAPWFGDHKVLRGGCWVTRSALIRNQYRNFYTPDRRDVWAGLRTCAL